LNPVFPLKKAAQLFIICSAAFYNLQRSFLNFAAQLLKELRCYIFE